MSRKRWLIAGAATVMIAAGGAGGGWYFSRDSGELPPLHLAGSLELTTAGTNLDTPKNSAAPGVSCQGQGGYSDIRSDMQVEITADGKTMGVTTLGVGHLVGAVSSAFLGSAPDSCQFEFTLNVDPGHDFYTVTLGRRGAKTYSATEIVSPGELDYTLGR